MLLPGPDSWSLRQLAAAAVDFSPQHPRAAALLTAQPSLMGTIIFQWECVCRGNSSSNLCSADSRHWEELEPLNESTLTRSPRRVGKRRHPSAATQSGILNASTPMLTLERSCSKVLQSLLQPLQPPSQQVIGMGRCFVAPESFIGDNKWRV